MNYNCIITENFQKEARRLIQKYASLKGELEILHELLLQNPRIGVPIGQNAYKLRIAVKSKGRGKRAGLRVITYLEVDFFITDLTNIFLLSIFDKSETENITKQELTRLIVGGRKKKKK